MLPSDFPFSYNIIYESVTATINAIVSINRYPHNPHFTQELDILIRDMRVTRGGVDIMISVAACEL